MHLVRNRVVVVRICTFDCGILKYAPRVTARVTGFQYMHPGRSGSSKYAPRSRASCTPQNMHLVHLWSRLSLTSSSLYTSPKTVLHRFQFIHLSSFVGVYTDDFVTRVPACFQDMHLILEVHILKSLQLALCNFFSLCTSSLKVYILEHTA